MSVARRPLGDRRTIKRLRERGTDIREYLRHRRRNRADTRDHHESDQRAQQPTLDQVLALFATSQVQELHAQGKKSVVRVTSMICRNRVRSAGYASELLILLKTVVTAAVTWLTPVITARAIRQQSNAYSTRS